MGNMNRVQENENLQGIFFIHFFHALSFFFLFCKEIKTDKQELLVVVGYLQALGVFF